MNETGLSTPLTPPEVASELAVRKPRKRELKNLTRREGIWYFNRWVKGERQRISLETRDLVVAKAKRDGIVKAANGAEVERVLGRSSKPYATLGEIFGAYRKAPTVRANATTRERNIGDVERLVRAVRGPELDVDALRSTELTKQLVKEWQSKRLAGAAVEAGDVVKLEAAKRSLNSLLTHVQSLFSAEARDDYGTLHLPPNIKEFAEALPVPARKQEEPTQLTDAFVTELLGKVALLQKDDAGAWATFQLMTWGGLRNKECLYARESWLEPLPGDVCRLTMKPAKDFMPKGNSRAVILPAAIAGALLSQLPAEFPDATEKPDRYLVPGDTFTDRNEAVYRRLNNWLKKNEVGADAGKIAYRLRKYFLSKVAEQQGILFAQAAAGHSSRRTTEDHYVGKKKMAEPIKLNGVAS